MTTFLMIAMFLSGILFMISVLLMSPKWGLGFGIWWSATWWNEYGSKKSVEHTLKKAAILFCVIFVITVILYPYINRKTDNNTNNVNMNLDNIKINSNQNGITWSWENNK